MVQKKVCIFGARGVGKRTLTSRFRDNFGSERHLAATGVQIRRKEVVVGNQNVTMMVWDVADHDDTGTTWFNYLRGMSGYLLVADGTRPSTLERAREIYEQICTVEQAPPSAEGALDAEPDNNKAYVPFPYREVPFILLLNKSDLVAQWIIDETCFRIWANKGWPVLVVSAKENRGVEEAFLSLGRKMLNQPAAQ